MNFQLKSNTVIIIILCLLVFPSQVVLAKDSSSIKVDKIIALNPSKQSPHTEGLIAWTYGRIYHLDTNLNVKKIIKYDGLSIFNIIQVSNSLFIFGSGDIKGGEGKTERLIIEYDLSEGVEKSRWSSPTNSIFSIASDDNTIIMMSLKGEQLKLTSSNFQKVAQYKYNSYYISTNKQEPVICMEPNITKQFSRPSICFRKGEFNWKRTGAWGNLITPPFICNNFLIENIIRYERATKSDKIRAFVSDISTGKQLATVDVGNTSPLSCIGTEIIYASNASIIIRTLPTLAVANTLITTSKEIQSVTMLDNSVFWVDQRGTIHKKQLQRQ